MGLMSAMHSFVVRLDDSTTPESVFESIMKTLSNVDSRVNNDYFYVLSGIAYAFKKKLSKYQQLIQQVWEYLYKLHLYMYKIYLQQNLINHFLNQMIWKVLRQHYFVQQILQELCGRRVYAYMNTLNQFFGLIKNPNFNRELKLYVDNAIADIILGLKEKSFQFLSDLKEILQLGFAASMDLTKSSQNVYQDYAERLKETMTSFYTCILHVYCEHNMPHFDLRDIVDWFIICVAQNKNLRLNMLDQLYFTIPEMKIKLKDFTTSDFVIELIRKMSQFNDKDYHECVSFAKQLLNYIYGFQLKLY